MQDEMNNLAKDINKWVMSKEDRIKELESRLAQYEDKGYTLRVNELLAERGAQDVEIADYVQCLNYFIGRVEGGTIHSKTTYQLFKDVLEKHGRYARSQKTD
jgi:hypothetical protein